ncbi:hypothetical protein CRENBAI_007550 [Crenichthys baileyi]|uniref:Secreted protein n=1 Tax=Crenichthys baileyi TaxID=28760 RepID=A0AAV9R8T9_9TELE
MLVQFGFRLCLLVARVHGLRQLIGQLGLSTKGLSDGRTVPREERSTQERRKENKDVGEYGKGWGVNARMGNKRVGEDGDRRRKEAPGKSEWEDRRRDGDADRGKDCGRRTEPADLHSSLACSATVELL